MRSSSLLLSACALAALGTLLAAPQARADDTLTLDGQVPDDGLDHFFVEFEVPAGIVEIEVLHDDLSEDNILDWGLLAPGDVFRGWGGGNSENAVVGLTAASRSYLPGPIDAGTWKVVIGKAQLGSVDVPYHLVIDLREAGTLPAQPERAPYVAAAPLSTTPRWFAGDFHVHSRESGDARVDMTFDEIADFARGRGLDFVALSDHNTVSQLDFIVDAQGRHPDVLFVPSVEFTTYDGHANGFGATAWIDHKIGQPGVTIEGAATAFRDQGAIFSINHPTLDLGDACIGCAWKQPLAPDLIGAVEVSTGGLDHVTGFLVPASIQFWDDLCAQGFHVPAIGGSDDHKGGAEDGPLSSPIGDPTTLIGASELSVAGLIEAIRAGRTVVKLGNPSDPMVVLSSSAAPVGDTISAPTAMLSAEITGAAGGEVQFVKNGEPQGVTAITSDPFVAEREAVAPESGEDRCSVAAPGSRAPLSVAVALGLLAAAFGYARRGRRRE
ncbi:MAG: CehA/McbA family metallohydrolase [Polyangiaceae bacterium]